MRWRIYYADGSTYSDAPEEAPKTGVQVIATLREGPNGPWVEQEQLSDYYFWTDDGWHGSDLQGYGLWEYLVGPGWRLVLFGSRVTTLEYRAIVDRAVEETADWVGDG